MAKQGGFVTIIIIIFGLILAYFALGGFVNAVPTMAPAYQNDPIYSLSAQDLQAHCGLTVLEPVPNQKSPRPLIVRGYVNGCGWEVHDGIVGTAVVLDKNDIAISATIPLKAVSSKNGATSFAVSIPYTAFSGLAGRESGTVIIQNNQKKNLHFVRIPVLFSR